MGSQEELRSDFGSNIVVRVLEDREVPLPRCMDSSLTEVLNCKGSRAALGNGRRWVGGLIEGGWRKQPRKMTPSRHSIQVSLVIH